ncbi:MAG: hypothetical protein JXN61_05295 [Sedimentisphaerales bacterium]|nr:hypothetical protein [Sedimentisphaerales bacterium]
MNEVQAMKTVILLRPQLKNNGAFANNTYVDFAGWNHARFLFVVGDTDAAVGSGDDSTPPFIEQCDTTGGDYTPITDAELSAVIGTGDDNKLFAIDVDLTKSHKRYGRVNAPTAGTGSNGANLAILCQLSKGAIAPHDAAGMGLEELVTV